MGLAYVMCSALVLLPSLLVGGSDPPVAGFGPRIHVNPALSKRSLKARSFHEEWLSGKIPAGIAS